MSTSAAVGAIHLQELEEQEQPNTTNSPAEENKGITF